MAGFQIGYNTCIVVRINTDFITNYIKRENNISLGDMVLYTLAKNLKNYPEFNSYFDGKTIFYPNINIGYSIKILEKPAKNVVIREADKKSLMEVSQEIKKLSFLYLRDQLTEEHTNEASVTLLNFSSFNAVSVYTPLYHQQSALFVIASEHNSNSFNLCLTFDVRVTDCQRALNLLNAVRENLEGKYPID